MSNQNYTATISVEQSPKEAFDAIRNVQWMVVGRNQRKHRQESATSSSITTRTYHTCTMKLVELVPGKGVAWLVTDNYFSFTEDKTEWKGTKVVFDIAKKGDEDRDPLHARGSGPCVRVLQRLLRRLGTYIRGSLKSLIATGKGSPNAKDSVGKGLERGGKNL